MNLTTVFAEVRVQGIHRYETAPDQVYYLRYPHRHIFVIKAFKKVTHDDRDVEFIMLKNEICRYLLRSYYNEGIKMCDFEKMSCEMISKELIEKFDLIACEVSEDGENGSLVQVSQTW